MILQSLKMYYNRKAADPNSDIAPPGWEHKEIPYVIVLDREGTPVDIQSTVEGSGKTKRVKKFLVPQGAKKTSAIKSQLLWDNLEYAVGITIKKDGEEKHKAFRKEIDTLGALNDVGIRALKNFGALTLEEKLEKLRKLELWETLAKETSANVTFKLAGETGVIANSDEVREAINRRNGDSSGSARVCLVTGERDSIETLHPSIKGVWGGNPTGTSIVSFNLSPFCSFGKNQGANAPVGKTAVFAYITALNTLLEKDSENRMQVGEASTVFWSERPTALERNFPRYFAEPPKDDPDRGVKAVKELFESIQTGSFIHDDRGQRFYVLGLSPNAARIAVRFWIVSTVGAMETNISRFFNDTEIVHGPKQKDRLSIFRLLVSTAVEGKSENIPPNVEGDFMRAILEGLPYPKTLLAAAIRRIRAEHDVTYPRAALVKACLNRSYYISRSTNNMISEELAVALDLANKNIGYRLGRLFAVLEKIQSEANPGINATIRDRYYGAASGTPVTVFPNLMRLKNHHLSKLENEGRRVNFERLLAEILGEVADFPKNLSLEEQGRFAIGYYHQTQDFYTKKSDKTETEKRA